jgi:hypothetical protein
MGHGWNRFIVADAARARDMAGEFDMDAGTMQMNPVARALRGECPSR